MQRQQDDDTANAAAIVLAAAARTTSTGHQHLRHQLDDDDDHATKKTRWWSRLKAKLACFRPHGHPQRIFDASPETGAEQAAPGSSSLHHYARHAPQPVVAFVAPPPSPASSALTSGSPSPTVLLLNAGISSCYSSPTASIFAVGPYARSPQQLVSPPAFSAGHTEPSTAPLTPPPEPGCSPHLLATTTPSSPEVPLARFLCPPVAAADRQQQHCSGGGAEGLLLNAYQLQPGSPILVSPGTGSTSSSPPSWTVRRPVRARNDGLSLLDGGRIPITEEGGGCGSGGASRNDDTRDDEVAKSGGEFVFGNNADAAAGGEVGGGGSLALGHATEQWPFHLAHG
ncbi:hypothetical protein SETIT_2G137300v2 [Setaria italica]|uniref:Uncharacterized protein n=1 Tax=Setaria italica TaxID=4555 RepID=K3ZUX6_SETIT|nr:uncharacterized protein At1g76660 [Setaria italica]XP_022679931.1 uncharacterized protein At1g76660 [Setaria italica]XP_022679932.1 uncharacterized protein At1g76660 [Setaria italica]XP_022679933.1 uncharacterized protein At1g76660 [Setaria italica]XP_022679934.1 uncharacterized protein At1g76660 [Setaria italica]XP_022679935.1 uncharacterized protein At1g76660 [Setaria italica]XP_022679936.1 uncharacterized protein At1g76660 [Setaria italica]XP_022679937.1 uncharacterized protein At1g766